MPRRECRNTINPDLKCITNFDCWSVRNVINDEVILGNICYVTGAKRIVCLYPSRWNWLGKHVLCYRDRTYWKDGNSVVVFNGCGGKFDLCYEPNDKNITTGTTVSSRQNSRSSAFPTPPRALTRQFYPSKPRGNQQLLNTIPGALPSPNTTNTSLPTNHVPYVPTRPADNTRKIIAAATGGISSLLLLIFLIVVIKQCKSRTKQKRFHRHVKRDGSNTIPNIDLDETIQTISNSDMTCKSTEFLTFSTSGNVQYASVKKPKPTSVPDARDALHIEIGKGKTKRAPQPVQSPDSDKNTEMYYMDASDMYNRLNEDLSKALGKRRQQRELEEEQNIYNKLKENEYSAINRKKDKTTNDYFVAEYGTIPEGMSRNIPDEYSRFADFVKK